jgi:hypothetical protein
MAIMGIGIIVTIVAVVEIVVVTAGLAAVAGLLIAGAVAAQVIAGLVAVEEEPAALVVADRSGSYNNSCDNNSRSNQGLEIRYKYTRK